LRGGLWLWSALAASAVAFVPLLEISIAGVLVVTVLNFLFSREINTGLLGTREVREGFIFNNEKNPTDLRKLVNHLRAELEVKFQEKFKDKDLKLPMPRLLLFNPVPNEFQIVTVEGRNPGKSALIFSSECFHYPGTKGVQNQKQLAALIQLELVKIYLRRGVSRTIVGMGSDLLATLQNLSFTNIFGKALWVLTSPLQFILLLKQSISRSYTYEAAGMVAECGRGIDLLNAIDSKFCPALDQETMPTNQELKDQQKKRVPYPDEGLFSWFIKPIADWIDSLEYSGDDKSGFRIVSMVDFLVREIATIVKEWYGAEPRTTNVKAALRPNIKSEDGLVSMETAYKRDVPRIRENDKKINNELFKKIPEALHYPCISPNGTGCVMSPKKQEKLYKAQMELTRRRKLEKELVAKLPNYNPLPTSFVMRRAEPNRVANDEPPVLPILRRDRNNNRSDIK